MSIADEIERLAAQRSAGHLSDAEFERAKSRLLDRESSAGSSEIGTLRRSLHDRWIGGVCGGLAKLTGMESWIFRLLFVVAVFFGGFGFIPYVLLWIFVPEEDRI